MRSNAKEKGGSLGELQGSIGKMETVLQKEEQLECRGNMGDGCCWRRGNKNMDYFFTVLK